MLVDSSALIPLIRVGRLSLLRELYGKVRTTRDVYRECVEEGAGRPGQAALETAFGEWIEIVASPRGTRRLRASEDVELADASLLAACGDTGEEPLSNDYHLLRVARARGVRGRWLTSAILEATRKGLLTSEEAKDLMGQLVREGMRLSPEVFATVLTALQRIGEANGGGARKPHRRG